MMGLRHNALHCTALQGILFMYYDERKEGYTVIYSLSTREIPRPKPRDFLMLYFTIYPNFSHNTDILNF